MANTLNLGNGNWATKEDSLLAYNSENGNFKPLPFDFSRASSATVVNKDGLIETVGSGIPRIDFRDDSKGALLLEPQRTNLIAYSEDFTDASWLKTGSSIVSGFVSPDGTTNAFKLVEDTSTGVHYVYSNTASSGLTPNITYSFSFYVKPSGRTVISHIDWQNTDAGVNIDVENETTNSVGSNIVSVNFTSMGDGFKKVEIVYNFDTLQAGADNRIYLNNGGLSYTGNGTSGIYIWGAQLEVGSYATSYIPTQGSAVTRVADSCNGAGNNQVINSNEGVLYYESTYTDGSDYNSISISNTSGTEKCRIWYDNTNLIFATYVGGVNQTFIGYPISKGITYKIGIRYKLNDFALFVDGVKATNIIVSLGGVSPANSYNKLNLNSGNNYNKLYGNVKDLRVYNTALTDKELQALTS